eukprot:scaffold207_cov409-Prasinococcus_capsulatus_cf.AAC.43
MSHKSPECSCALSWVCSICNSAPPAGQCSPSEGGTRPTQVSGINKAGCRASSGGVLRCGVGRGEAQPS